MVIFVQAGSLAKDPAISTGAHLPAAGRFPNACRFPQSI